MRLAARRVAPGTRTERKPHPNPARPTRHILPAGNTDGTSSSARQRSDDPTHELKPHLCGNRTRGASPPPPARDPGGPVCGCGRRGCWEALIGLHALLPAAFPGGPGQHWAAAGEPPEAKAAAVARLARAGDAHVLTALADIGRWVGIGAANLANVFNPRAIVLGGYFTLLAEWILPPAARALAEGVLAPDAGGCSLTTSSLGFSAAARGGAIHVADQIISDPAMLDSRRSLPAIRPSAPAAG